MLHLLQIVTLMVSAPVKTDSLQGTWAVKEFVANGKPIPAEDRAKLRVTFDAADMKLVDPGLTRHFKYKLDSTQTPKVIDLTVVDGRFKGQTCQGIYELSGETLKLCLPNMPEIARPMKFESPEGGELGLFILERVRK